MRIFYPAGSTASRRRIVACVWGERGDGKRRRRGRAGGGVLGRGQREAAGGVRDDRNGHRGRNHPGREVVPRGGWGTPGDWAPRDGGIRAGVHLRISRMLGSAGGRLGDGEVV